ncbi:hypothetical protein FA95DRAFT_374433 [Auriscalpium vulgare]|uniref:Uncharacterized protein n=1 Tax=Auriscalpium vulgare TaxID=40419 RepID=A0ACB8RHE9_9AGAM|nr:hypothetical protein FA95DRAFT_374433 [Auriscalpium vulgare]
MSEDDRAAKTARARALLNKKKQQKKSGVGASAPSPTPGSPLVRAYSPAPSPPVPDDDKTALGDIFSKPSVENTDAEIPWLASLPRVGTPSVISPPVISPIHSPSPRPAPTAAPVAPSIPASPAPPSPAPVSNIVHTAATASPTAQDEEIRSLRSEIQNQQQTISLLVSEKASLSAAVEQLGGIEAKAREAESFLAEERAASQRLRAHAEQLETAATSNAARIEDLSHRTKELGDQHRDQGRELQLTKGSAEEYKANAERYLRRVRELEDQIQSDDRVERLEASLQNVQDRASELEFQLSKLKQAHASLKADRDEIESELRAREQSEAEWAGKHADLEGQHGQLQAQLKSITAGADTLSQDKITLHAQLAEAQNALVALQDSSSRTAADHAAANRQIMSLQNELRTATRRAEEAERIQQDLQAEGTSLMRSLEEMRPKIVELTNAKLELTDKIAGLERSLRERDGVIAQLESSLQESQDQHESVQAQLQDAELKREQDRSASQENLVELQRGYTELQSELADAHASVRDLELERASQRQLASKQSDEIDRVVRTSHRLKEEAAALRHELEERERAKTEHDDFLERARADVEGLRADVTAKDEEIEQLRAELSAAAAHPLSPSLDREMLSSLKQQHHLELSAAQSQIRALQTTVFEAEALAHSFQKQINTLEEQLAQLRATPRTRPFSPETPSRPSSRARNGSDDLRRASLTSRRSSGGVPPLSSQPVFGANLSPETRHKRRVSLGMLKARIDSEVAATSHPSSRAISPLPAVGEGHSPPPAVAEPPFHSGGITAFKRPQFLDESHVFWCHSCRGELVIL